MTSYTVESLVVDEPKIEGYIITLPPFMGKSMIFTKLPQKGNFNTPLFSS